MRCEEMFSIVKNHFDENKLYYYVDDLRFRPEDEYGALIEELLFDDFPIFYSRNVQYSDAGCSKWVLQLKTLPGWIIKVPFQGCRKYEDDEYLDRYEDFTFQGAKNEVDDWDYCLREFEVYLAAKERSLEKFFPETLYLGDYHGLPIYAAEEMNDYYSGKCVECGSNYSNTISAQHDSILSAEHIEELLESGAMEEEIHSLLDFFTECNVGDFHNGNFGWDEEGHLRLIDFSDFDE